MQKRIAVFLQFTVQRPNLSTTYHNKYLLLNVLLLYDTKIMNLFLLWLSLQKSAKENINSHVNKIIMEATELLYTVWMMTEVNNKWKKKTPGGNAWGRISETHNYANNPLAMWASLCRGNYRLLVDFALELCKEYKRKRGKSGLDHAVKIHIDWCNENLPKALKRTSKEATQMPQAISESPEGDFHHCQYKNGSGNQKDTTIAYRMYYLASKGFIHGSKYTNRERPEWFTIEACERWRDIPPKSKPKSIVFDCDSLYLTTKTIKNNNSKEESS